MDKSIEEQVIEVLSHTLEVDKSSLTLDSAVGSVPSWDSMGHLAVISALENHFNIQLSVDDVVECESIEDFSEAIKLYLS